MKFRPLSSLRPLSLTAALALLAGVALPGCGGGGAGGGDPVGGGPVGGTPVIPAGSGKLSVSVAWPTSESRLVPENALSIRIELLKDGATYRSLLLAKPAAQADFAELPLGAIQVRATAFPALDGSGAALATTTVGATIAADVPVSVPVTMASTVASLALSLSTLDLVPGTTSPLATTAKNAAGGAVLVPASALTYTSSAPALVKVTRNADGTATLAHLAGIGTATITVKETGSGRTATLPVTVRAAVAVSPVSVSLSVGGSATFSASVLGPSTTTVTWSVQETGGGSVTSGGVYTAPAVKGTYHVVATSVADPTRKATATVTIRSGSGSVIVN